MPWPGRCWLRCLWTLSRLLPPVPFHVIFRTDNLPFPVSRLEEIYPARGMCQFFASFAFFLQEAVCIYLLDQDQVQGITGRTDRECWTGTKTNGSPGAEKEARPGPRPMDHGETHTRRAVGPDQDQWSTWRTDGAGASSTRTKSSGSTGSTQEDKEKDGARGRTVGIQNRYAPPASKDAADGASWPLRHKINT